MGGALQIIRIYGIPIKIHWTFGLIFIWLGITVYSRQGNVHWENLLWSALALITLFICVILHELGHALTARRFGVKTSNILLLPIGGLAILERLPERPRHELWVAVAGPAVNFGLALLFSPFLLLSDSERLHRQWMFVKQPGGNVFTYDIAAWEWFVFSLVVLNLAVAIFNLVPAYPMDGGRALRALLSMRYPRIKATLWATRTGQAFGGVFLLSGLYSGNWALVIIGMFIYLGAGAEKRSALNLDLLSKHQVKELVRPVFTRLYLNDPVDLVTASLHHGLERHFLVFDEWQTLQGSIDGQSLTPAKGRPPVRAIGRLVVDRDLFPLLVSDPLSLALEKFQTLPTGILPVYERDYLVGVLDESALKTFLNSQKQGQGRHTAGQNGEGSLEGEGVRG